MILPILFSVISGLALAAAFPRPGVWPLAWVALVPFLLAIRRSDWKRSALLGVAAGFAYFGALLYWIGLFGALPWFLLSLFQGLYFVPFALAYGTLAKQGPWLRLLTVPAAWTACEWLRSIGFLGFTWGDLAISQYRNLPFVQLASVTGTWGLTYLLVMGNEAAADLVEGWRTGSRKAGLIRLGALAAAVAIVHLWGAGQMADRPSGKPIRVAAVQGSIDQDQPMTDAYTRSAMSVYARLTRDAARFHPDLVIWPETVIPGDFPTEYRIQQRVSSLARELRTELMVGSSAYDYPTPVPLPRLYNAAFLFDRCGDLVGRYYKVHLVPFGEVVPLRRYLPLLERYRVTEQDYDPGPGLFPIRNYGVMICFESIFPPIARELVRKGAGLLIVTTNDCWFKRTAAPEQHLAFSVFRAVENRRCVVRNATTGISCLIDSTGRVTKRLGLWRRGVLFGRVRWEFGTTFYAKHGDWFAMLCMAVPPAMECPIMALMELTGNRYACSPNIFLMTSASFRSRTTEEWACPQI